METPRLSTGYPNVDTSLSGGLPIGSVVIYTGTNGMEKQKAGLQFISDGLKHKENCLIITTKYTPTQYELMASDIGIDLSPAIFLDAVSWRMKRINPKMKSQSQYELNNLADLNALLATVMKICTEVDHISRVFFDSLSSLLLYSTPGTEQVYKFVELLSAFIRKSNITMVVSIEALVHDPQIVHTLLFLADGHIRITCRENTTILEPQFLIFTDFGE